MLITEKSTEIGDVWFLRDDGLKRQKNESKVHNTVLLSEVIIHGM